MSDPTDSDQAIRDIVAQLQGIPPAAPIAAMPPQGVMPGPAVTPTMQYAAPPPVSPLGQMAALPRPAFTAPAMGSVLAAQLPRR